MGFLDNITNNDEVIIIIDTIKNKKIVKINFLKKFLSIL